MKSREAALEVLLVIAKEVRFAIMKAGHVEVDSKAFAELSAAIDMVDHPGWFAPKSEYSGMVQDEPN